MNVNISGYDAALYSAATNYYSQQQHGKTGSASWMLKKANNGNQFKAKPKGPPKTPQLHYCDVCKISCAGPQVSEIYSVIIAYLSNVKKVCGRSF